MPKVLVKGKAARAGRGQGRGGSVRTESEGSSMWPRRPTAADEGSGRTGRGARLAVCRFPENAPSVWTILVQNWGSLCSYRKCRAWKFPTLFLFSDFTVVVPPPHRTCLPVASSCPHLLLLRGRCPRLSFPGTWSQLLPETAPAAAAPTERSGVFTAAGSPPPTPQRPRRRGI